MGKNKNATAALGSANQLMSGGQTAGSPLTGPNIAQAGQNKLMDNLYSGNQQFNTNYGAGVNRNLSSYDDIMSKYNSFLSNPWGTDAQGNPISGDARGGGGGGGGGGTGNFGTEYDIYSGLAQGGNRYNFDPEFRGALSKAIGGYGNFADTGGFSEQDKQDLRARAISPTRAIYANALANVERNRNLQQFSPNYNAAMAKMAREQSYGISDANVNANASIAQMVQQGKLAGMAGLTNAGGVGQGAQSRIDELNAQMQLAGLSGMTGIDSARLQASMAGSAQSGYLQEQRDEAGMAARLAAMSGMTGLYGTTPGLANTFGNQLLGSQQNLLAGQGLQNQLTLGQQQNANNLYAITKGGGSGFNWGNLLNAGVNAAGSYFGNRPAQSSSPTYGGTYGGSVGGPW